MRLSILSSLLFSLTALAADVTFIVPITALLPNPSQLPSSTSATLARLGQSTTTLLTRRNTFDFTNLKVGSYLLTVTCRDFAFQPLRVDITNVQVGEAGEQTERVDAWQTFPGNEWGNKGEHKGGGISKAGNPVMVQVMPVGAKDYYMARSGFAVLDMLKSPMILIAIASLALLAGMPYLMDSMDEETKAEFEEMQAKSPLAGARDPSAITNFDLAGWMAGKTVGGDSSKSSKR